MYYRIFVGGILIVSFLSQKEPRLSARVQAQMLPDEKKLICQAAERAQVPLSTWIRSRLVNDARDFIGGDNQQ